MTTSRKQPGLSFYFRIIVLEFSIVLNLFWVTTRDNVLIFDCSLSMPQSMQRAFRDNMDLNYIFNYMNIIIIYIIIIAILHAIHPLQRVHVSILPIAKDLL